ncbi:MAG: hypothetical protein LBB85_10140 [Dysgonamonadaceae bacterium]|jgi:hypothetical protein|nr:hypothetical protein [Dysgonamonadaceae bacterium]
MKKAIINKLTACLFILLTTGIVTTRAQDNKNSISLGAGANYGIGGNIGYDYQIKTFGEHSTLTAGGYFGFQRGDGYAWEGSDDHYEWDRSYLLSPRFSCIYAVHRNVELFAAILPGLLINDEHSRSTTYEFFPGITLGCRVRLFKNIFLFTEEGYNITRFNIGISVKF